MILKDKKKEKIIKYPNLFKILTVYFFSTILIMMLIIALFFNTAYWHNNKNEFLKRIHLNGVYNYKYIPQISFLVLTNFTGKIETLNLNLSQKNKLILEKNRKDKILNKKIDFVTAKAKFTDENGKIYSTDIRLKGDRDIHYKNISNSSYKLNLDKENYYKGMKSFSIQKPRIRNYINEWIFHELSEELNLVKLNYDFINLQINGENKGLYAIEESFSNNLIERNSRRAGPIFGLHEDFSYNSFSDAKLDPYQKNYWSKPENIDLYLVAKSKLLDFKNKNKPLHEILDVKKWANYFAICDLLYTHHGYTPKSVKFYYNPISGLIEPIPFDGHKMPGYNYSKTIDDVFNKKTAYDRVFLADKWFIDFFFTKENDLNDIFFLEYIKSLKKITDKDFLDNFLKKKEKFIKMINAKIYLDSFVLDYPTSRKDGIGIYYFDKNEIYNRAEYLKKRFLPSMKDLFIEDNGKQIVLFNKEYINQRLKIIGVRCKKISDQNDESKEYPLNNFTKYGEFKIAKPILENNDEQLICTSLKLKDKIDEKYYTKNIELNFKPKKTTLNEKNFLKFFYKKNNDLFLRKDIIYIDKNLYIPPTNRLVVKGGQQIKLSKNAFIFSEASIFALGSNEKKISISGKKSDYGGGIIVKNSDGNVLKHVNFEFLKGLDSSQMHEPNYNPNYRIYGAINFYNSNVQISNSFFNNIKSEDALNIMNSKFQITNTSYDNIQSDAIDIDFGDGVIKGSNFNNILNDAIDLSGSEVVLENIVTNSVGDKSISSGENSNSTIRNIKISNSFIGIANKDGSVINADNVEIHNVKIPFAAYIKKPNYENSKMSVKNTNMSKNKVEYLISNDQTLILEEKKKRKNLSNKKILSIIYEGKKDLLNKI